MKKIGAQPAPWSVEEARDLAHIIGKANGFKTGSTTYGFYDKFHGEFEAVNLETGEVFVAPALLCPPMMEMLIKQALVNAGAEGGKVGVGRQPDTEGKDASAAVMVGFILGVKPVPKKEDARENVGQGYEYTVRFLAEPKRSDALAELRALSDQSRKALPAPDRQQPKPPAESPAPPAESPAPPATPEKTATGGKGGKRR